MPFAQVPWPVLIPFAAIGFLAQIVDGTLGMGFGVVSNTVLVILGLPPAAASAAVRIVESFVNGFSGISHAFRGNVDWRLFTRLVVPSIFGALLGMLLISGLTFVGLRPAVFAYLGAVGIYLTWRAPRRPQAYRRVRMVGPVGLAGALIDTTGGGWRPIVTGYLLAQGADPRTTIGTANAAEFFVTITVLSSFIGTVGTRSFTTATLGLLIGGIAAAPVSAVLVGRLSSKVLMLLVGSFLVASSFYGLVALSIGPIPSFPRY